MKLRRIGISLTAVACLFLGGYYMTQTPNFVEGLWATLLAIALLIGDMRDEVYSNGA